MNPETSKTNKFVTATVIVMVGITLYWTFRSSGPYRYLAELQVKWFGSYVPKLTAMVIILAFLAIAGVIKVVLRGAERPLVVVGFGGWMYFNGMQAGSLQQLTAVDFETGKLQTRIVYADVRGHLSRTYRAKKAISTSQCIRKRAGKFRCDWLWA